MPSAARLLPLSFTVRRYCGLYSAVNVKPVGLLGVLTVIEVEVVEYGGTLVIQSLNCHCVSLETETEEDAVTVCVDG